MACFHTLFGFAIGRCGQAVFGSGIGRCLLRSCNVKHVEQHARGKVDPVFGKLQGLLCRLGTDLCPIQRVLVVEEIEQ